MTPRPLRSTPPPLAVAPGEVHVVFARISRLLPRLTELEMLLSPDERARAARFHFEVDRHRQIVSHAAQRLCLGAVLGVPPGDPAYVLGFNGKPRLAPPPPPAGPPELRFNLSHSGDLALVALARDVEVGVDVELMRLDLDWESLARHTFTAPEVNSLLTFPMGSRLRAFYRLWTCKEAVVKARGDGLSLPLELFEVRLAGASVHLDTARMPDGRGLYTLTELEVDDRHTGTVVTLSAGHRVVTWELGLDGNLAPRLP